MGLCPNFLVMKIAIVVTDKKKGKVEIPITKNECSAMYSLGFMVDEMYDTLKLNNMNKDVASLHSKFLHLVQDIIHDGKTWTLDDKGESIPSDKWYIVKKPRWKK